MSEHGVWVRVNQDGDIPAWKVIVGAKKSHRLSKPVFPLHQPNYDFDHGALIRVKGFRRRRGEIPLTEEFARRK